IAARPLHAEKARRHAELLLAAATGGAGAAADPRMDQPLVAFLDAGRLGAERRHFTDDLVAHGERRDEAAVLDGQLLAAAQIVPAFPDVQVAVADAGRLRAQQHLAALRIR